MENPAHWQEAEKIVDEAVRQHRDAVAKNMCGWSLPMRVTHALYEAGFLSPDSTVHAVVQESTVQSAEST